MLFNGLVDTCVYVLWYRECRLELLKMAAKVFPYLQAHTERMRLEVFEISFRTTHDNDMNGCSRNEQLPPDSIHI
ncbi:hypothetical protein DPMN_081055 [Dreissena polymorpha]|uniref:Uncharacterized protein n=1 Tax=Dreissena polymorpha TaxID=45954 RepID=A0A9D4B8V0_DREPO|nr:hypothetical protein DPMN_081026 [Dreissena polymorpha]KAH3693616.1 hypothetical protein DPMN_081055 [Dreissena polymorpha]